MNPLNPYVMLGALGALLASFLAGGLLGWHEKSIRVPALLEAQQTTDQQTCAKAQQLTKDANDALQKQRDSIAARLNALKLQHPATCVRVAGRPDVSGGGVEHAGQNGNGVSSDWLRNYAAEAEQYRSEVTVCTDFLAQERAISQK